MDEQPITAAAAPVTRDQLTHKRQSEVKGILNKLYLDIRQTKADKNGQSAQKLEESKTAREKTVDSIDPIALTFSSQYLNNFDILQTDRPQANLELTDDVSSPRAPTDSTAVTGTRDKHSHKQKSAAFASSTREHEF